MNYKRVFVPNSYVHLIVVAYNRKDIFVENIELLRASLKNAKQHFGFDIIAICVLPNHIHMILNPDNIKEYPKIITSIKYHFSKYYDVGVENPTYGLNIIHTLKRLLNQEFVFDCKKQLDFLNYV